MAAEPKTYTGWKAGLTVVFAVIAFFAIANLVAGRFRSDPKPGPGKVVTTVTPSGAP